MNQTIINNALTSGRYYKLWSYMQTSGLVDLALKKYGVRPWLKTWLVKKITTALGEELFDDIVMIDILTTAWEIQ